MKSYFANIFFLLNILFLLTSCASIVAPNGGPKDEEAPQITSSNPENLSKNYAEKSFNLTFNEFIQLKNVEEQLIITPTLKYKPEVNIKKKSIIVKFSDTLEANTTYTFNFGESILDITEGKIASNLKYIFSTGSYIDSSKISGTVIDAFNLKPQANVTVMLYKHNIDSLPLSTLPTYITKTNGSGNFIFTNLKPDYYKIFALIDKNSNFLYDQPSETIGFLDTVIPTYDTAGTDLKLFSFTEELKTIKLLKKNSVQYGKVLLIFNKPYDSISFKNLQDDNNRYIFEPGVKKDTMNIWVRPSNLDSMHIVVYNNEIPIDTVELKLIPKEPQKNTRRAPKEVIFGAIPMFSQNSFNLNQAFELQTFAPIDSFDYSKTTITNGNDTLRNLKYRFNQVKSRFFIDYNWKENSDYKIEFLPGAFTDILGLSNDTLEYKFKTQENSYYAQLAIDLGVTNYSGKSIIIQLLTEKEQLVFEKSISSNEIINLTYQIPGKYKLKAIIDENTNGKWDKGSYTEKQQPEKVLYYKEEILLRSNWEIEVKWDIK